MEGMISLSQLSADQLRKAALIKEKIDTLAKQLNQLFDQSPDSRPSTRPRRRKLGAAGRPSIIAAQKVRWANNKGNSKPKKAGRRKMSAAGRARIPAAAKARWARAKAAGKDHL